MTKPFKRIATLTFCLIIALQITILPTVFALETESQAVNETEAAQDKFIINDGVLTEYKGQDIEVSIPNTVKKIGSNAFKSNEKITKVVIPDSVDEIGESAFEDCKQLTDVKMSKSIKIIGANAFRNCKLINDIKLPEGLIEISKGAFESSGLVIVKLPSTLKTLGDGVFKYSGKLKILELNDGLETIGKEIITSCYNIQGLRIPASVKKIEGPLTTDMGSKWKWLLIENDNVEINNMDSYPKFLTEQWVEITYYGGEPSTLKSLYDTHKSKSSKVIFKNKSEFHNIRTLEFKDKEITLSPGEEKALDLNILPEDAIDTRIHFSSSNKDIVSVTDKGKIKANKSGEAFIYAHDSFGNMASVKVTVELSEEEIFKTDDNGVLIGYYGHDTIIAIPEKVKEISSNVFMKDKKIEKVIVGKNVEKIHDDAFSDCVKLTEVDMSQAKKLQEIGARAFKNCDNLESIIIPESVEKIGANAFEYCKSIKKIKMDTDCKLNKIEKNTFAGCVSLKEINLPKNCTHIGAKAFSNVSNLKSLTLPEGLKTVGEQAFFSMKNLEEINFPASFVGVEGGKDFPTLFDSAEGENKESLKFINIDKNNPIYHSYKGCVYKKKVLLYIPMGMKEADIEPGTEEIGDYVANAHMNLEKIVAHKGLKKVGKGAFLNCFELKSADLPDSVEEVCDSAFLGCEELEGLKMPKKLKRIGKLAFYELESIDQIVIPDGVTELDEYSVSGLDNAKHVVFSRNINKIARWGASWVPKAEELYIPENMKSIGYQGFAKWSSVTHLELPRSLKTVDGEGFAYSDALKSVFVPGSVKFSDDIFKNSQGSTEENEAKKLYIFTDKESESIKALAKKQNIETIMLKYNKKTKNNRKIEIQQLENLLSDTNHKSKFELNVKENTPNGTDKFSCQISGKEDGKDVKLKSPLKVVIELLPNQEKTEYDAYMLHNGKYEKLDTNRLNRFVRVEIDDFGTLILTEKGKNPEPAPTPEPSTPSTPETPQASHDKLKILKDDPTININNGTIIKDGELIYIKGQARGAELRIVGLDYEKDKNSVIIKVDGKLLTSGIEYTLRPGSIIVGFEKAYLDGLKAGKHLVEVSTKKGKVSTNIVIQDKKTASVKIEPNDPSTGDSQSIALSVIIMTLAIMGMTLIAFYRKRNN